MQLVERIEKWLWTGALLLSLSFSNPTLTRANQRVLAYTGQVEFDSVGWIVDAELVKLGQNAIGLPYYADAVTRKQAVRDYLRLTASIDDLDSQINTLFTDPAVTDPQAASADLRAERDTLQRREDKLAPLAESVLQQQVATVLADQGLTTGGQPIPPVLYHATPLPLALIVSPRTVIQSDATILLLADITVDSQVRLEDDVDHGLGVSALIVPVGGIGAYPTMVMRTTDLSWLGEVISHEWTHNYLNLRPLGLNYDASPELRTMNETTASISGKEIGRLVLQNYYPEYLDLPPAGIKTVAHQTGRPNPPDAAQAEFDFRAEMHETRVIADALLAEDKVDEAEAYMEKRRQIFWDHGYAIRKLNQAYFAFYGAYADVPGGAAGEDPVGPAVRALRAQSPTLADFINRMAKMQSFSELQEAVDAR